MAFRYVANNLLRGSGISGTIDATYQLSWLTDGNPGTPIQRTGNLSLSVTPPAEVTVDTFALVHHTVSVTASISGAASASITAGALEEDGTRLNPFAVITPATFTGALTLTVNSNPTAVVIGELYAGLSNTLDYDFDLNFDPGRPFAWEGEFSSIPPYDRGLSEPRRWSGDLVLTDTGYAKVRAWYTATRRGTLPSLIIPNDEINDAAIVLFSYRRQYLDMIHRVTLELIEIPRTRW